MSRPTVLALMPDICAWLEANDIPAKDVPVDEVPIVANGTITVRVYKRTLTGNRQVSAGGNVASEVIAVPLKVQPPAVLKPWLAGQVPYRTAKPPIVGEDGPERVTLPAGTTIDPRPEATDA